MSDCLSRPAAPFAAAGPIPLVIAHRGGSLEAPENTCASVAHGIAVGAPWQEVDVTLSAEGTPVVIHDDLLQRTTDGSGWVEQTPLVQLQRLRAGAPLPDPGTQAALLRQGIAVPTFAREAAHTQLPTLAQIVALRGAQLMLELKKTERVGQLSHAVVEAVRHQQVGHRVAVASFERELLAAVHSLDAALPLVGVADTLADLQRMLTLPLRCMAVDKHMLAAALAAVPPHVAVWVWTVYGPQEAQALAAQGAHGLITDAPRAVLAALHPG
jgi:glycerophosphoryl diester phosphodiesterase